MNYALISIFLISTFGQAMAAENSCQIYQQQIFSANFERKFEEIYRKRKSNNELTSWIKSIRDSIEIYALNSIEIRSMENLAKSMNLELATLKYALSGNTPLRPKFIARVAQSLRLPPLQLISGEVPSLDHAFKLKKLNGPNIDYPKNDGIKKVMRSDSKRSKQLVLLYKWKIFDKAIEAIESNFSQSKNTRGFYKWMSDSLFYLDKYVKRSLGLLPRIRYTEKEIEDQYSFIDILYSRGVWDSPSRFANILLSIDFEFDPFDILYFGLTDQQIQSINSVLEKDFKNYVEMNEYYKTAPAPMKVKQAPKRLIPNRSYRPHWPKFRENRDGFANYVRNITSAIKEVLESDDDYSRFNRWAKGIYMLIFDIYNSNESAYKVLQKTEMNNTEVYLNELKTTRFLSQYVIVVNVNKLREVIKVHPVDILYTGLTKDEINKINKLIAEEFDYYLE